jgi:hypothetical protein
MDKKQGESSGKRSPPGSPAKKYASRNISGRILDSASGLLRDSLAPDSTQQAHTLAHVLAREGKAGSSMASASTEPGTASEWHRGSNASHHLEYLPNTTDTFREPVLANGSITSTSRDIVGGMSLDQFMHNAQSENKIPTWQHTPTAKGKQIASRLNGHHTEHHASDAGMSTVWDSITRNEPSLVFPATNVTHIHRAHDVHGADEVRATDGADVVKLLQDPNTSLWMDMPEEQDLPWTISEEDTRIAEEIAKNIDTAMASKPGWNSATSAANRGQPFLQFTSFFDDIENYHEEVWGYLRPLVEQARGEKAIPGSPDGEEGPATRRLRMVLAHIDRSA